MKKSLGPILAIAVVVAALCTAAFYALVSSRLTTAVQAGSVRGVLVASRDLARGTRLEASDVTIRQMGAAEAPAGALVSVSQISGAAALQPIAAGEPLTQAAVVSERNGGGVGVPMGMRAISVKVHDSQGVMALLKPGLRVDVQAIHARSGSSQDAELRTVLENAEVLAVNRQEEAGGGKAALPGVTLLVTPAEADVVGLADTVGRIRLLLRNPLDAGRSGRVPVAVAGMMRGSPPAAPRPAAPVTARPAAAVTPQAVSRLSVAAPPAAGCEKPVSSGEAR